MGWTSGPDHAQRIYLQANTIAPGRWRWRAHLEFESDNAPDRPTAARTGGRGALDDFLAGVERRAYVTAKIATGSADEAMDLVQDAMLQLASRYADRPPAEWGALFHTILQSRVRDWYRRQRVRNRWRVWLRGGDEAEGESLEAQVPDPGPEPGERLAQDRQMRVLESALRALPLRQQQAFLLRVWEGLDVEQTARAMGCSAGSVKTHFSRAVHSLRAQLNELD